MINKIFENRPFDLLAPTKENERVILLADIIVSLVAGYIVREYIKKRCEQAYLSFLKWGDAAIIKTASSLGISLSLAGGGVYSIPLIDYIKATSNVDYPYLLACNQVVVHGTVRCEKTIAAKVVSLVLADKLRQILPLKVDKSKLNEDVIKRAEEIKSIALKNITKATPATLKPDCFPPCIKKALAGVPHGVRNFAIAFLLPTFLSRARILPPPREGDRISNYMPPEALLDEIMPLITQAALSCNPPLFDDQPHERENILKKMGLDANGKELPDGKWYVCPSCDIIKDTPLCEPDDLCKKIKNPLSYYILKVR